MNQGLNFFVGKNGQGKSNLMEALYALSIGKSFRTSNNRNLFNKDTDLNELNIFGMAHQNNNVFDLSINLNRIDESNKIEKVYIYNSSIVKSSDFIGKLNIVFFEAKDLDIIIGSPSYRRRFLDIHISQQDISYLKSLQRYNKVLQNRNRILKDIKAKKSSKNELEYWTEKLIQDGIKISKIRNKKLEEISIETLKIFQKLSKNNEKLNIRFIPSFKNINSLNIEDLTKIFNENFDKEISYGSTFLGPHKDDFEIKINDKISSEFSSRGQIRTATLSIKLGEANALKNSLSDTPIIVLDDILSELDFDRRKTVVNYIREYEQIFLTSPDDSLLKSILESDDKIFRVNNGNV